MWLCFIQMLQAGGRHSAQNSPLLASSLKLATESIGAPGGNGQPFWSCSKAVGFLTWRGTSERCRCFVLAPTIETEPGRNKMLPG